MKLPASEGFIKKGKLPRISSVNRVALIRKGNEMFNQKKFDIAKRIYITTHYSDGLLRMGRHYEAKGDFFEAFRLYWQAGDRQKVEYMAKKMAQGIRYVLRNDAYAKLGRKSHIGVDQGKEIT